MPFRAGFAPSLLYVYDIQIIKTKADMVAKIVPFPDKKGGVEDASDVETHAQEIARMAAAQGATGMAVTLTCNGKILSEQVSGELRHDKYLALAGVSRLMQRISSDLT